MGGLAIGWEHLTGYYRATDSSSRQRAEWPPHPGRIFMALAAAWFETGENADEGNALRWLETLDEPQMILPPKSNVFSRTVVDVYVPVNDQADPYSWPDKKKKPTVHPHLGSVAIGRSRQARTFPCTWVSHAPCFLHWPNAFPREIEAHRPALERLCSNVNRIGHPSSLVRMWLADNAVLPHGLEAWAASEGLAEVHVRRITVGMLDYLVRQFNRKGREEATQISSVIARLKAEKPKGAGARERQKEIKNDLERLSAILNSIDARVPIRPKLSLWSGYRRQENEPSPERRQTVFDSDLLVLTRIAGPPLPLTSTFAVTQALRGTLLSYVHQQQHNGCDRWKDARPAFADAPQCYASIPAWISGHTLGAEPLRDGRQHLAIVALPFVGSDHADGHLLGAALIFPRDVPRSDRGHVLGRFVLEPSGNTREITLRLGSLGLWTLAKRDWSESRLALKPETWTAHPEGATTWATVTPMVLDRFPKADQLKERTDWQSEVVEIIAKSCEQLKLPTPADVDFGTTSWHQGSPRATAKRRPLRGQINSPSRVTQLGDGFPAYPPKGSNSSKPQLHVYLRFSEPVVGPLLIGSGRFLGYGLCKPLLGDRSQ